MGPEDDPEAYLVTFERVAAVAGWAPDQWAVLLAPYLTGPAQRAYRGLPDDEARVYARVKAAILDAFEVTPETFRRRFRGKVYPPGVRPRAVAQELRDAATRWLQPEHRAPADITEQIVLEQFMHILPTPARA
ncbi:SCAN domain-containing protein 1-like [Mauremys mutica]|uniref:SCAN domain-containing protein 1-like n=1 Tax=Mauremys mutica TaxID=74926 RepID=UPI001D14266D|nr:SCAN domain-containing protein 1-like [Mauremys mutica]